MTRPLPTREIIRPLAVPAVKPLSIPVAKLDVTMGEPLAGVAQPIGDHP